MMGGSTDPNAKLLLLVNRETIEARFIAAAASRGGWRTICVHDPVAAESMVAGIEGERFSAALLDHSTVGEDGLSTILRFKQGRPNLPIVMLTSSKHASHAVEAMRAGAHDYLLKPFSADRLLGALRHVASINLSHGELQPLSEKLHASINFESMIGADPEFRNALAHGALAARGHGNVLVEGEGGTGKSMLIHAIHAASPRAKGPLEIVDVRSMSEAALMSALFGHEKGAFPGAFETQVGSLQHCDGGTLIIQEANRLPRRVQEKLAKALAEARVRPAGAEYSVKVDVRVLAGSNQELSSLVSEGSFEPELYEMLSPIRIKLPPLRRRIGDIPALARHFVSSISQYTQAELSINADALHLLTAFDWPGNVRQLQSVLMRASATCEGRAITANHLPALAHYAEQLQDKQFTRESHPEHRGVPLYAADGHLRPLQDIEADVIRLAIGHYNGRITEVARRLGVGRSTLYRRLNDLGIDL
jgi:DNA-binding NtrC family response regulator